MIIYFAPYSIKYNYSNTYTIKVSPKYIDTIRDVLDRQPWIALTTVVDERDRINVYTDESYDVTVDQITEALDKLCEFATSAVDAQKKPDTEA